MLGKDIVLEPQPNPVSKILLIYTIWFISKQSNFAYYQKYENLNSINPNIKLKDKAIIFIQCFYKKDVKFASFIHKKYYLQKNICPCLFLFILLSQSAEWASLKRFFKITVLIRKSVYFCVHGQIQDEAKPCILKCRMAKKNLYTVYFYK